MEILKPNEYKVLLESYEECFGRFFPKLHINCTTVKFEINGQKLHYKNITGISVTSTHFILEMESYYYICLPISENAEYYIEKVNFLPLFDLWNMKIIS